MIIECISLAATFLKNAALALASAAGSLEAKKPELGAELGKDAAGDEEGTESLDQMLPGPSSTSISSTPLSSSSPSSKEPQEAEWSIFSSSPPSSSSS